LKLNITYSQNQLVRTVKTRSIYLAAVTSFVFSSIGDAA